MSERNDHETPEHTNALIDETSPYLLQHAHNPVDWLAWGDAAFDAARERGVPIFLSIGYATCYWCHVMEREVFENEAIAQLMNDRFVCIKVDREQRPDVDDLYMAATQIMTRRGGWPMSVFLTPPDARGEGDPGLRPFWCGTYIPPTPMHGMTSFPQVLESLSKAWQTQRSEVLEQGDKVAAVVAESLTSDTEPGPIDPTLIDRAVQTLARTYDRAHGGFGDAPKFPTPSIPRLLLATLHEQPNPATQSILGHTLDRMARGGIFDQVGGGFHRYSVDERWLVPHFEKMLYDNGQLAELYADAIALAERQDADDTRSADAIATYKRTLRRLCDYVLREMTDATGAFWSAQDAEVDGQEGLNYLWTPQQFDEALKDPETADLAKRLYGLTLGTNFQDPHHPECPPTNVLFMPEPLSTVANDIARPLQDLIEQQDEINRELLAVRDRRKQPTTDDKVLTSWNGMMIAGLAKAGAVLGETAYLDAAAKAADAVIEHLCVSDMTPDESTGSMHRAMRAGRASVPAFLEDYAQFAHGLIELHRASLATQTHQQRDDLGHAKRLMDRARSYFAHPAGGCYDTLDGQADLFVRARSSYDGATPSANSQMIHNLIDLAELTGDDTHFATAGRDLRSFAKPLAEQPTGMTHMLHALLRLQRHAPQVLRANQDHSTEHDKDNDNENDNDNRLAIAITPDPVPLSSDRVARFDLTLTIEAGYHLTPGTNDQANPIRLAPADPEAATLDIDWPIGDPLATDAPGGTPDARAYAGTVTLPATLRVHSPDTDAVELQLDYQPCTDTACERPRTKRLTVRLTPA
ncbi:MAG: DUF255 domain-containing protein [Phycisphaeraceae bacterium]